MKKLTISLLFITAFFAGYAQTGKHSIEGGASALNAFRILKSDGSVQAERMVSTHNPYEEPAVPRWGIFAKYHYQHTKRVFFSAGLMYERLGYRYVLDDLRYSDQLPPDADVPVMIKYNYIYNVIRIPLTVSYTFINKERMKWYATAGISADIMADTYSKRKIFYRAHEEASKSPNEIWQLKTINASFTVGIGSIVKLSERNSLRFNLLYSHNMFAFNTDPVKLHLISMALSAGFCRTVNF